MELVSPGGPCSAYRRGTLFLAAAISLRNAIRACAWSCGLPAIQHLGGKSSPADKPLRVSPDPFKRGQPRNAPSASPRRSVNPPRRICASSYLRRSGQGVRRPDRSVWSLRSPPAVWASLPSRPAAPGRNARAALTSSSFQPFGCCPAPSAGLPVALSPPTPLRGACALKE